MSGGFIVILYWVFLFIALLFVVMRSLIKKLKKENLNLKNDPTANYKPISLTKKGVDGILRKLGANIVDIERQDDGCLCWIFDYCGGRFALNYLEGNLGFCMTFFNFYDFKISKEYEALRAMDLVNKEECGTWTCYSTKADEVCFASAAVQVYLITTEEQIVGLLNSLLNDAFEVKRSFCRIFEDILKGKKDVVFNNVKTELDAKLRRASLEQDEQEMIAAKLRPHNLNIEELLRFYHAPMERGNLIAMRLIQGDNVETFTTESSVMRFDLIDYLCQEGGEVKQMICSLDFENYTLLLTLYKQGVSTDKAAYYQCSVNFVCEKAMVPEYYEPTLLSDFTVMVRLDGNVDNPYEAQYAVEEVKRKYDEGKEQELTDEQRMLWAYDSDLSKSIIMRQYWGMKYYNADCNYQALSYFLSAREMMLLHFAELVRENDNWTDFYRHNNLLIGEIYMAMGDAERAYFYFKHSDPENNVFALEQYSHCVCLLNEADEIHFLLKIGKTLKEFVFQQPEPDPEYRKVLLDVNRRTVQLFIKTDFIDYAEQRLNEMIQNDFDKEYALAELAKIKEKKSATNE